MGKVRRAAVAERTAVSDEQCERTAVSDEQCKRTAVTNAVIIGIVDRHFQDSIVPKEDTVGHYVNCMGVYGDAFEMAKVILSDPTPSAHGAGIRAVRDYLKNSPPSAKCLAASGVASGVEGDPGVAAASGVVVEGDRASGVQLPPAFSLDDILGRVDAMETKRRAHKP
jgi:hypothetical protein